MLVMRFVPILAAFALGVVVTSWVVAPEHRPDLPVPRGTIAFANSAIDTPAGELVPEVGIPPSSVTPAKPAPNAGQRRALARALDALEKSPPEIEAQELDEETKAAFIAGMRSATEPTGANP